MMQTYNIQFEGYWLEKNKAGIPAKSGVYMVYRSKYDVALDKVTLLEIIYIGQSSDVKDRIANHDRIPDFQKTLTQGETLSYAFAPVMSQDLDVVEKALIIAQRPRLNEQNQSSIDFGDKQFQVSGKCALLKYTNFTIN
jgi:excinuclease UvrABC nuclease subunit